MAMTTPAARRHGESRSMSSAVQGQSCSPSQSRSITPITSCAISGLAPMEQRMRWTPSVTTARQITCLSMVMWKLSRSLRRSTPPKESIFGTRALQVNRESDTCPQAPRKFRVDKTLVRGIEPAPMRICLKYARVFWAVAILLMAGGQAIHAYEDFTHPQKHASERQTSESEQPVCLTGHTSCCHSHSHVIGALAEAPNFSILALSSDYYFERVDSVVEGPIREIDYPPQLS